MHAASCAMRIQASLARRRNLRIRARQLQNCLSPQVEGGNSPNRRNRFWSMRATCGSGLVQTPISPGKLSLYPLKISEAQIERIEDASRGSGCITANSKKT